MPTTAVLFDLDGTLIDSFQAIAASVNHVRARRGIGPLSVEEVTRHVGRGATRLLAETVGVGDPEENYAAYAAHHETVIRPLTVLLPGAEEALTTLHARGARLGVCSNKPIAFTRELVKHLGIDRLLAVLMGPEDVGRHKPAPDMLLEAMRRLGARAEETLYVGDMRVDIETARAAGVRVWVVPTGTESRLVLEQAGPDRVLSGLAELASLDR